MSANGRMTTNLYSECWWLAWFFLTHWLTLCFTPAVWCTHSSLMILQSFFQKWPPQINHWRKINEKIVKESLSRRLSGLGKGNVINHMVERGAGTLLILNWVDHILKKNPYKKVITIWFQMILPICVTLTGSINIFRDRICVFACTLCGQPQQGRAWLVVTTNAVRPKPSHTSAPLLTPYGVDTNRGEAVQAHLLLLLTSLFSLTETYFQSRCLFVNL